MANKKNDLSNISGIGQGILSSLSGADTPKSESVKIDNSKTIKEENSISVEEVKSKGVNKDKSKNSKTPKNKSSKDEKCTKSKRSFMLDDITIKRLQLLKMSGDDDLSTIVQKSIEMYFKKKTGAIEEAFNTFNEIKDK